MAEFAYDPDTGLEYIQLEDGSWVPFIDTEGPVEAAMVNTGAALRQFGRGTRALLGADRAELRAEQAEDDALLAGLREARPVASFVGDMLPGLATLPIGGTAALAGRLSTGASFGLSGGLGALEGLLRFDPDNPDQWASTLWGAAGGVGGEVLGRMAGRVVNAIRQAGATLRRSDVAEDLIDRGLQALPSEQLNVPGQNVGPLQRLEQGAQASVFSPRVFREIPAERGRLMNETVGPAIGLDEPVEEITPDVLSEATDRLSERFQAIASRAFRGGRQVVFTIGEELGERIRNTRGQIRELINRGRFSGLETGQVSGEEILIARRALSQDAANAASRGEHELAEELFADVEELDRVFASTIRDPEIIAEHARLREQYRNLQILSRPGVINNEGQVLPRALARRMGQGTGYGRIYREMRADAVQPETAELFEVTRLLADPSLQPFRSSGTAENLALRDLGAAAGGDLGAMATQVGAPLLINALGGSPRAANTLGGLMIPGGSVFGRIGGEAGPDLLDMLLMESMQ